MWILASSSSRTVKSAIECLFTRLMCLEMAILVLVIHRHEVTDTERAPTQAQRGCTHSPPHVPGTILSTLHGVINSHNTHVLAPCTCPAEPHRVCVLGYTHHYHLQWGREPEAWEGEEVRKSWENEKDTVLQKAQDDAWVLNLTKTVGWGHWLGTKWQNTAGVDPSPCS